MSSDGLSMSSTALVVPSLLDESLQDFVASVMVAASLPGGKPANTSKRRWRMRAKELRKALVLIPLNRWIDKKVYYWIIFIIPFLLFGV